MKNSKGSNLPGLLKINILELDLKDICRASKFTRDDIVLQHMVQTGMAAPYGGGVFPPPVNGVAGVVGAAGAAGDVKPPPPVPVKEESAGAPQQPPPTGGPQVPPAAGAPHPAAPGAPTAASFSPPPPPNGVDQQAIVSFWFSIEYDQVDRWLVTSIITCSIKLWLGWGILYVRRMGENYDNKFNHMCDEVKFLTLYLFV